ncbi:MAG: sodium:alanine symporter family protein [Acidobacteriota bacterium]
MFAQAVNFLNDLVWNQGIPAGDQDIPFMVIALLGTGVFFTFRLGFIQLRRLGHGFAVTTGRYDDPAEPGDVSHFQALTTALSATVGIGNIAGVALAIHFGGPGALFWMWITAFLGMAVKYSEVTLAQRYRVVEREDEDPAAWEGSVSGGPMYYIEKGLGKRWKPVAMFFAAMLILTSFLTGNAVQANTVADVLSREFGVAPWIAGLTTATIVGAVILGGIRRIGKVTGILAPLMALVYVGGAMTILVMNASAIPGTFGLIVREAFNPTAGVAGTGVGAVLLTMMWGVKRGLFSNEAGQGSAPIAHAAAKTDEPVSEGVVALLEPFIDTLVICTMTGLVILISGVWDDRVKTEITLGGDVVWVQEADGGRLDLVGAPESLQIADGVHVDSSVRIGWHEVALETLFIDEAMTQTFTGRIEPAGDGFVGADGTVYASLWAGAVENGAPLTALAFRSQLGGAGNLIVLMSVILFGISTAISWSYYGDRCANYLFGKGAILPYKVVFLIMHFVGAVASLTTIWTLGDVALGLVTFPNLVALVLLSGTVAKVTDSYFERQPWHQNKIDHDRAEAARKRGD